MPSSIHIIYATGSGHTEHVVNTLCDYLAKKAKGIAISRQYAEEAQPNDLDRGDLLVLASGTWNTGGVEGQLQPHMFDFLRDRAKDSHLDGKEVALIALGDHRYYYTARAGEHLRQFVMTHGGKVFGTPLTIIDEPYGQEERVRKWGDRLLAALKTS